MRAFSRGHVYLFAVWRPSEGQPRSSGGACRSARLAYARYRLWCLAGSRQMSVASLPGYSVYKGGRACCVSNAPIMFVMGARIITLLGSLCLSVSFVASQCGFGARIHTWLFSQLVQAYSGGGAHRRGMRSRARKLTHCLTHSIDMRCWGRPLAEPAARWPRCPAPRCVCCAPRQRAAPARAAYLRPALRAQGEEETSSANYGSTSRGAGTTENTSPQDGGPSGSPPAEEEVPEKGAAAADDLRDLAAKGLCAPLWRTNQPLQPVRAQPLPCQVWSSNSPVAAPGCCAPGKCL